MATFRIATWNVGGGLIAKYNSKKFDQEDLDYFATTVKNLNCDVVCFQELLSPLQLGQPVQAVVLARMLDLPHFQFHPVDSIHEAHIKRGQLLTIGTFSRLKILKSDYFKLPNPNLNVVTPEGKLWTTHDKGLLATNLDLYGQSIRIFNIHNVPFHIFHRDFMESEFRHIRQEIEDIVLQSGQETAVLIGDVNYEDLKELLPNLFKAGFSQAISGVVTDPIYNKQMDHIVFSKEWELVNSAVLMGKADHYLCYADLRM